MKRFAATVVILMLGILPATAENVTTEPVRGADLDAMVREVLKWIAQNTEYSVSGSPDVVFVDRATAAIAEYEKNATAMVPHGIKVPIIGSVGSIIRLRRRYTSETIGVSITN